MKAIRISDGKQIEVVKVNNDSYQCGLQEYHESELDFNVNKTAKKITTTTGFYKAITKSELKGVTVTPCLFDGISMFRDTFDGRLYSECDLEFQDAEQYEATVIRGWAARDKGGDLFMYCTKPERNGALQMWMGKCADFDLRNRLFPDLTWESDPIEIEITIKRKKI